MEEAKTLVLVRHGKAQRPSAARIDGQRKLTKAGRRAAAAQLSRALALLEDPDVGDLQIWTSPSARTRQTAEQAAKILGVSALCDEPSLLFQDRDAFLAKLAASPASCVVAVGHNPFLEELAERLCGLPLSFSTAAVAAVRLPGRTEGKQGAAHAAAGAPAGGSSGLPGLKAPAGGGPAGSPGLDAEAFPAQLLWFVQGPRSQNWKTLVFLEKAVNAAMARVEGELARFLCRPDEAEALHDLRVSIRTLRSLLCFLAPFLKAAPQSRAQNQLRRAVRKTSRLRELDVLLEQIDGLEDPAPDLRAACLHYRERECSRLLAFLGSKKFSEAFVHATAAILPLPWKAAVEDWGLEPGLVRERFASQLAALDAALGSVDLKDADAVHSLRKKAKRARYVAEKLGPLCGEQPAEAAGRMKTVQDRLGALCDARASLAIIAGSWTEGLSDGALHDLAIIAVCNEDLIDAITEKP